MGESDRDTVTGLLLDWRGGDKAALDRLVPLLYEDLRQVAHARMRDERPGHALQTTALVHEAYVRLVHLDRMTIRNRAHFFALAARLMRQILVDYARRAAADKRGGAVTIVGLDDARPVAAVAADVDVLALDQALDQLAAVDARLSAVVELRYFAGLDIDEAAAALDTSTATVERDWALAKAWLFQRLSPHAG